MPDLLRIVLDTNCAANASYIVSDDRHFDILNTIAFPRIAVMKLQHFLEALST